jgi:hypothetical protein
MIPAYGLTDLAVLVTSLQDWERAQKQSLEAYRMGLKGGVEQIDVN